MIADRVQDRNTSSVSRHYVDTDTMAFAQIIFKSVRSEQNRKINTYGTRKGDLSATFEID